MSLRIFYIFGSFGKGGTEHHFISLLKRINRDGFQCEVFIIHADDDYIQQIRRAGVPVFTLSKEKIPRLKGLHLLLSLLYCLWIVGRRKVDIIHTYFFWAHVFGVIAAHLFKIRAVVANREDTGFRRKPVHFRVLRYINKYVKKIIAVSDYVRQIRRDCEKISPEKLITIRNGVSLNGNCLYVPSTGIRREYEISEEAFLIGVIANMNSPIKGHEYLLEAAKRLMDEYNTIYFLLVGEGRLRASLQQRAEQLGVGRNVIFTGYREDVAQILKEIDLFALFSLSEGLPISILEAMCAKKSVLATRVGGIPEVVIDGETGLLVEARDVEGFVARVKTFYENRSLGKLMGRRGYERVSKEFSLERVVRAYEELYHEVLNASSHVKNHAYDYYPHN